MYSYYKMDLISAVSDGNARTRANVMAEQGIAQARDDFLQSQGNKIHALKEAQKTAMVVGGAKDLAATAFHSAKFKSTAKDFQTYYNGVQKGELSWTGSKVPDLPQPSEPTRPLTQGQQIASDAGLERGSDGVWRQPTGGGSATGGPPRAEGTPAGGEDNPSADASHDATVGDDDEGGGMFKKGLKTMLGASITDETLDKIGKVGGALGSVAVAGVDIDEDFKGGHFHLAGDNWEKRAGNALQIGGAIADVGGVAFPPLALVGGLADLAGGVIGGVGDLLDEHKDKESISKEASATESTPEGTVAAVQTQVVTGGD